MREHSVADKKYRLPSMLNSFQLEMYVHLVNWKWEHIPCKEAGDYTYRGQKIAYDAILPKKIANKLPTIYPPVVATLKQHHEDFPFKLHEHFNHMASSQAANVNLFLPVLLNPKADVVLRAVKPDLAVVARDQLDNGYRLEFWDGKAGSNEKGLLGDHSQVHGTDTDIAIAYRNRENELCLWLIEHKLTESEFSQCNGCRSKGKKANHDCEKSFSHILKNKNLCYYHDERKFTYWEITEAHQTFFKNHGQFEKCPFRDGTNQLWRNQLLALALEQKQQPYKHVFFSVVKHPRNSYLDESITKYQRLIANNDKFFLFTSADVVAAAEATDDYDLREWVTWYKRLYRL